MSTTTIPRYLLNPGETVAAGEVLYNVTNNGPTEDYVLEEQRQSIHSQVITVLGYNN